MASTLDDRILLGGTTKLKDALFEINADDGATYLFREVYDLLQFYRIQEKRIMYNIEHGKKYDEKDNEKDEYIPSSLSTEINS